MRESIKWLLFLLLATAVVIGLHNCAIAYNESPLPSTFATNHSLLTWVGAGTILRTIAWTLSIAISLLSTYKLGEYLAPRRGVGTTATFILMSMFGFMFEPSIEMQSDTIFTAGVALSIWQGVICIGGGGIGGGDSYGSRRKLDRFRFRPLLGFAVGLALTFCCQGSSGTTAVIVALLCYMAATARGKWLVSWRPLLSLAMALIMVTPYLLIVASELGWDDVRFLVLYGQFSGFSATHYPLDSTVSLIWVMLPWSISVLFFALRSLWRREFDSIYALTIISTAIVATALILTPRYLPLETGDLMMLLPLIAIFIADKLQKLEIRTTTIKTTVILQKISVAITVILGAAVNYYLYPLSTLWMMIVYGLLLVVLIYALLRPWVHTRTMIAYTVAASAILWISLEANTATRKATTTHSLTEIISQK